MVGEGGFEPPKSVTTDLQSAPFGRSGIPPNNIYSICSNCRVKRIQYIQLNSLVASRSISCYIQVVENFIYEILLSVALQRILELVKGVEPPTC